MNAPIDTAAVQAIVFDLGNVLLRLDNDLYGGSWPNGISGIDAADLADGSAPRHEDFEAWVAGQNLWYDFETGRVSTDIFVERLTQRLGLSPKQVLRYWNSLLLGWVPGMAAGLEVLRKRYPLYVLSNTNAAHIDYVTADAKAAGLGDWTRFFEYVAYSFELDSVKPEAAIYERAQAKYGVAPEGLLFVDDRPENVTAARVQGWQAVHLPPGEDVFLKLESLGL